MITRIRDVKRGFRPQAKISALEWDDIMTRYNFAKTFLAEDNPMSGLMRVDLEKAKDVVLENRIHEVREARTISKTFRKIFITPKQEQLDELVGQVKYIRGFLSELESWITRKEQLEDLQSKGQIEIENAK